MTAPRILLLRVRGVFAGRRRERELSDEIEAHLEELTAEHMRRGLSRTEARHAARRAFGGVDQIKEAYRDQRGLPFVEVLAHDLRYALRTMRRNPAFAAAAVLSLALGIGANTAIFSLLDAVLLKSLPVKDPQELYVVGGSLYPVYQAFTEQSGVVDVFATSGVNTQDVVLGTAPPERAQVSLVSGSYFTVLGVPAIAGRTFTTDDDRIPGAHPIAVISHGYWQRRFAADPAVLGRQVRVGNASITVVGVAPPGFFGERVGAAPDFWIPLSMWGHVVPGRNLLLSPGTGWLNIMGRLKPGIAVAQADAVLTQVFRRTLTDVHGPQMSEDHRRDIAAASIALTPARNGVSSLRRPFARPLQVLMAVAALVLLIACANVANLLLARAATRRREIGLRLALGIGRKRLVHQLLTESLLLSAFGGAAGLVAAWWGREVLLRMVSADGSRLPLAASLDGRVLAFAAAVSIATGLVFGLAPAWQSARVDVLGAIGTLRQTSGHRRSGLSPLLVAGQVALSAVLLVGAGLFLRTLVNLRSVHLGFEPTRLLILDVNPGAAGYTGESAAALGLRLVDGLESVPGVASVSLSENGILMGRESTTDRFRPEGVAPAREGRLYPQTRFDLVGPRYFATMQTPLLSGRDIHERDTAATVAVVVINEEMARRFFGSENPIGRRMFWGPGDATDKRLEIIGVAREVKQRGPRDAAQLRFYLPLAQHPDRDLSSARLLIRTAAAPEAVLDRVRQAIRAEDSRLSVTTADAATDLVDRMLVQERMTAALSSAFGALALTLACVGVYGLMAYRVARRTGEIGIRMALGAAGRTVLWMIVREDLRLVGAGVVAGVPLAMTAWRAARGLLFGIDAGDPSTLAGAALILMAVGLMAGSVPALRAARIEPALSLRHD